MFPHGPAVAPTVCQAPTWTCPGSHSPTTSLHGPALSPIALLGSHMDLARSHVDLPWLPHGPAMAPSRMCHAPTQTCHGSHSPPMLTGLCHAPTWSCLVPTWTCCGSHSSAMLPHSPAMFPHGPAIAPTQPCHRSHTAQSCLGAWQQHPHISVTSLLHPPGSLCSQQPAVSPPAPVAIPQQPGLGVKTAIMGDFHSQTAALMS